MATLQQAIEFAKQNPTHPKAKELRSLIQNGSMDAVAQKEGIDLSVYKSRRTTVAPTQPVSVEEPLVETPAPKTGILQEEIQKTGEQIAERFGEAKGFVEKAAVAGTVPLRAVGAGARAVGRAISEPLAPVMEKAISALPEEAQQTLGTLAEKGSAALEKIRGTVGEDVYQSLADTIEAFSLFGGGRVAKTGAEFVAEQAPRAIAKAGELASEATAVAGRGAAGTGRATVQAVITPTVQEAERILSNRARKPFLTRVGETLRGEGGPPLTRAQTAVERGVQGTETMIGVQARRINEQLWRETIEPAVKASDAKITKADLFAPIEKRIANTTEPGRKKDLQDAFDAIREDYTDINELSLDEAQSIKRGLDEFTPDKIFKGKSVKNEYQTLKNDMANAIRQKTYEALDDIEIKKQYLDWANLKELEKIGVKALTESGRFGGSGKLVSFLWDMAAVPIGTVGGRALYRVGNFLEFVGEKGVKTFGEFLKKHGYTKPEI